MKVAYVLSHINKSLQWLWFSEELKARNFPHFFIIIDKGLPILVGDLQNIGVPVYCLKHKHFFSYFINLYKIIKIFKSENPDIVHTSLPTGNFLGQLAAFICGIKKRITTCENASWPHDFNSNKQLIIDRITYWSATKIISTCESAYEYLATTWKINHQKLSIIYQGLKINELEIISEEKIKNLRAQLGINDHDFILGMVARFEFWKGHSYVLDAMKKVIEKYPEIKLYIFGGKGAEYEKIKNKIEKMGLDNHVFYKGFVSDPLTLYKIFDVHIHVPINKFVETFGINIVEGMISECPQMLTKSGIAFTTAVNMENCIVVDYCNSDQIADAIIKLKNDLLLRKKLAQNAKADALFLFNHDRKVNTIMKLYQSL